MQAHYLGIQQTAKVVKKKKTTTTTAKQQQKHNKNKNNYKNKQTKTKQNKQTNKQTNKKHILCPLLVYIYFKIYQFHSICLMTKLCLDAKFN